MKNYQPKKKEEEDYQLVYRGTEKIVVPCIVIQADRVHHTAEKVFVGFVSAVIIHDFFPSVMPLREFTAWLESRQKK